MSAPPTWAPTQLRAALPRTWDALLARFPSPSEIQLAAAPVILAGQDALLCAPTASGKTQAYLAPLVERHVPAGATTPRLLVVSPTRALANDLARRIGPPLQRAGVECGRWTGDHHDGGRMHAVTVLTPEGLDSRLSRAPDLLDDVAAVVLDELHVLDDTARGDQLRVLVARLRAEPAQRRGRTAPVADTPLQVVAASATVADPSGLAARYLADAQVVHVAGRRKVLARIVGHDGPESVRTELWARVRAGSRKVLVFCNTREQVEVLSAALRGRPPFQHAVFAHHGSLARARRLDAEQRFLRAPVAACVATSTLELGVDIGDVDLVALVGGAPDVPAMLQRVGRGGRRSDHNRVVVFAAGPFEETVARVMLDAQAHGRWFAAAPVFRPSVFVQQAISVLHARGSRTVDAGALRRRLPADLAAAWDEERLGGVLAGMVEPGWLVHVGRGPSGARYAEGPAAEALWARGQLHGNLDTRTQVAVVDGMTGETVGHVDRVDGALALGGRARRALQVGPERVVTGGGGDGGLPLFASGSAPVRSRGLATALLEGAAIPRPSRVSLSWGHALFHGLGTGGGALLGAVLRSAGVPVKRAGSLAAIVDSIKLDTLIQRGRWPSPSAAEAALGRRHAGLARRLGMGAWHHLLPEDEQRQAVGGHCDLAAVQEFLRAGPPAPVDAADADLWNEAAWA